MALEPVKIPQNVYVEDRVIGPVTLKQLFMCLAGGAISYGIWSIMKSSGNGGLFASLFSWSPLMIAAIFAFVKINGIPLFRMCLLLIEKLNKPNVRYWQPRIGLIINPRRLVPKYEDKQITRQEDKEENAIAELSSVLDNGPLSSKKEEKNGEALPIQKERIKAPSKAEAVNVDTVTSVATKESKPMGTPIIRDISPA
ncbi:MAG: PrgI family protein [bacterium]|nr:PrgI family protein [bacterium]